MSLSGPTSSTHASAASTRALSGASPGMVAVGVGSADQVVAQCRGRRVRPRRRVPGDERRVTGAPRREHRRGGQPRVGEPAAVVHDLQSPGRPAAGRAPPSGARPTRGTPRWRPRTEPAGPGARRARPRPPWRHGTRHRRGVQPAGVLEAGGEYPPQVVPGTDCTALGDALVVVVERHPRRGQRPGPPPCGTGPAARRVPPSRARSRSR